MIEYKLDRNISQLEMVKRNLAYSKLEDFIRNGDVDVSSIKELDCGTYASFLMEDSKGRWAAVGYEYDSQD